MTPQEIISSLNAEGVDLVVDRGNLKARSHITKITDVQKALIANNEAALIAYLEGVASERNCGSLARTQSEPSVDAQQAFFKEYKLPDGQTLQLTRDEFDRVVDLFRMLHRQSQKQSTGGSAA